MRKKLNICWALLLINSLCLGQSDYIQKIQNHRTKVDSSFGDTAKSILPPTDIDDFHGLHYYPIDEQYKVHATFKKKLGKPFEMQTSTARLPVYRKYGELRFKLDGRTFKLNVYQQIKGMENDSAINEYLFCPFRDQTNADSTYGGGRYLDFKMDEVLDKQVFVDFNLCYNPYCAYNNRYSCPIPPPENNLDIRIEAGVKKWHD